MIAAVRVMEAMENGAKYRNFMFKFVLFYLEFKFFFILNCKKTLIKLCNLFYKKKFIDSLSLFFINLRLN